MAINTQASLWLCDLFFWTTRKDVTVKSAVMGNALGSLGFSWLGLLPEPRHAACMQHMHKTIPSTEKCWFALVRAMQNSRTLLRRLELTFNQIYALTPEKTVDETGFPLAPRPKHSANKPAWEP